MNDTSPEMEERYRRMLMARTPAERLRMAAGMFDTARAFVRARLEAQGVPPSEMKAAMFRAFYGSDLDPAFLARVEEILRQPERGFGSQGGAPTAP